MRSNREIDGIIEGKDVVKFIKAQRLSVARMSQNRAQQKIMNAM